MTGGKNRSITKIGKTYEKDYEFVVSIGYGAF